LFHLFKHHNDDKNNEMKDDSNNHISFREKLNKSMSNAFGFESNIDISDETQVLYRRNVVIKNVIFLTNLLYTIILFVISFGDSSNWILTVLLFPVTYLVNRTLKKMIFTDKDDLAKQKIAMYVACFYMFLSSMLVYLKLKNQFTTSSDGVSNVVIYGEVGYAMLYVSLVVVSLYQDKKALLTICKWLLVGVTILHFTVTYNFTEQYGHASQGIWILLKEIFVSEQFKDIVLRTAVLILFMAALYVNVSISQYLMEERKRELVKRKDVEDDFINVVFEMFKVSLDNTYISEQEISDANILAQMSYKLANYLGLKPSMCEECKKYSRIYLDEQVDLENIKSITNKDVQFEKLREETKIGSVIAKRQAARRRIDYIVRNHVQGAASPEFCDKMRRISQSEFDQIIGICDVYITLRSMKAYKRPYSHEQSLAALNEDFKQYFDSIIYDRFINFIDEFKRIYEESDIEG